MRLWRFLPEAVAVILFAWAVSGCTNPRHWEPAIFSTRIEVGSGNGNQDRVGKRSWDTDAQWIAISWAPFEYWAQKQRAEREARILVEALYAAQVSGCRNCEDEECREAAD